MFSDWILQTLLHHLWLCLFLLPAFPLRWSFLSITKLHASRLANSVIFELRMIRKFLLVNRSFQRHCAVKRAHNLNRNGRCRCSYTSSFILAERIRSGRRWSSFIRYLRRN